MRKDYEKILNFIYSRDDLPQSLRDKFYEWLLSHENDEETVRSMYDLWEEEILRNSLNFRPESLSRILQDIGSHSDQEEPNATQRKSKWGTWMRYAAVFAAIILSVVITVIVNNHFQPIETVFATANGSCGDFVLPDGTEVKLNGGSRLCYNANDFGKWGKRKVSVEGEAYFDVAKDRNHPFEVMLNGSCVEVTGTKFEVRNYPYSNFEEVVLESGSVNISELGGNKSVTLRPDQRFILDRSKKTWCVEDTEASKYCRWIQKRLKLENEPVGDLLITIGRKYGVELNISPEVDMQHTLTITLQNDDLEDILSIISYLTGIRYDIKGHNLNIYAQQD